MFIKMGLHGGGNVVLNSDYIVKILKIRNEERLTGMEYIVIMSNNEEIGVTDDCMERLLSEVVNDMAII